MSEGAIVTARGTDLSIPTIEMGFEGGTPTGTVGMTWMLGGPHGMWILSPDPRGVLRESELWDPWTPSTTLPYALVSFDDLEITPVHVMSRVSLLSEALDLALASVTAAIKRLRGLRTEREPAQATDPQPLVSWLRGSGEFRVSDIADALHVSRRTLYNWLEDGRVPTEQYLRLRNLTEAVRRFATEWGPTRIKTWLTSGDPLPAELLQAGEFGRFQRAAMEALETGQIPLVQARRLSGVYHDSLDEPLGPLDEAARAQAFDAFARTRRAIREVTWHPRELTDSDAEDEE